MLKGHSTYCLLTKAMLGLIVVEDGIAEMAPGNIEEVEVTSAFLPISARLPLWDEPPEMQ